MNTLTDLNNLILYFLYYTYRYFSAHTLQFIGVEIFIVAVFLILAGYKQSRVKKQKEAIDYLNGVLGEALNIQDLNYGSTYAVTRMLVGESDIHLWLRAVASESTEKIYVINHDEIRAGNVVEVGDGVVALRREEADEEGDPLYLWVLKGPPVNFGFRHD